MFAVLFYNFNVQLLVKGKVQKSQIPRGLTVDSSKSAPYYTKRQITRLTHKKKLGGDLCHNLSTKKQSVAHRRKCIKFLVISQIFIWDFPKRNVF